MKLITTKFLHVSISTLLITIGIFLIADEGSIIAGKYTGNIYKLNYPANIIVATSLFTVALFFIVSIIKPRLSKKYGEGLMIFALLLFTIGFFL